jgi:hypothetical protein
MYLPSFDSFLRAIGVDRPAYQRDSTVAVPKGLFALLVELALEGGAFNEAGYLKDNPDVAEAIRKGQIENARQHYIGFGYFEGRTGGTPPVDERWYLTTYPDVAQAVKAGQVRSATEHYNIVGAGEGRSPNASQVSFAARWKAALAESPPRRR